MAVSPWQWIATVVMSQPRSRRWMFTLNNYTTAETDAIRTLGDSPSVKYLTFGYEVGEQLTPHLQGFVVWANSKTFEATRTAMPRCHLEPAKGTPIQSRDYCQKDKNFEEFGVFPSQGKRNDIDCLVEWSDSFTTNHGRPPSLRDIAREQPRGFIKHGKALVEVGRYRAPVPVTRVGEPRDWQLNLVAKLTQAADDRTVEFYVDYVGGTGKSWFQAWYEQEHPDEVQCLTDGKREDIAYALDESKSIFFFDVPWSRLEFLQYDIFEQLKNQKVFSTKYQSTVKIFPKCPHVIVFCNKNPDESKMALDRFLVVKLNEDPDP